MATLGIDFGTSYTFIVKYDGATFTRIGSNKFYSYPTEPTSVTAESMNAKGIRTAIGFVDVDHWIVGSQNLNRAIECGMLNRENICWDIKSKLRKLHEDLMTDESYALRWGLSSIYKPGMEVSGLDLTYRESVGKTFKKPNGGEEYCDALTMAREFFKCILQNEKDKLSDVDCIACGMPSDELDLNCPDIRDYEHKLRKGILGFINTDILELNLDDSCLLLREEPILAGISYFKSYPGTLRKNDVVLVIDIGGGTSDFALFNVDDVKVVDGKTNAKITRIASKGNASPAGDEFNKAMADCVNKKYPNVYSLDKEDYKAEPVSNAKESLFLSEFSSRIGYFKNVYSKYTLDDKLSEWPCEYTESEILNLFNLRGRRTTLTNNTNGPNIKYKIVYDKNHCAGLEGDGFGEPWTQEEVIEIGSKFEELYEVLASRVKKFLKDYVELEYRNNINKVLFVGGSCRIPELRDYICKHGGIMKDRCNDEDNSVQTYFLEAESKAKLSCSNAVALGAAYDAYDAVNNRLEAARLGPNIDIRNTLVVPELWIKFWKEPDDEAVCVLSQDFKSKGYDEKIYFPLKVRLTKDDVDDGQFLRFNIGRTVAGKKIFYPHRYIKKDETIVQRQDTFAYKLQFDEEYKELYFFADIINSGEVAIFVCPKHTQSDITQEIYEYRYVHLDKDSADSSRYEIIEDVKMPRKGCKKYMFIDTINKFQGKPFNIKTYLKHMEKDKKLGKGSEHNNQWYGWFLSDSKKGE